MLKQTELVMDAGCRDNR